MDEFIISVFYDIDNFCKELKNYFEHSFIPRDGQQASFEPSSSLSLSEIMTICVCFHLSVGIPNIQMVLHQAHTQTVPQIFSRSGQL